GRHFSQSFSNAPDQNYVFIWDRNDAFGRVIQGWHEVTARIGFVYAGSYAGTTRFGYSGNGIRIDGNRTRQEITLWSTWHNRIGIFDAPGRGLGGWSLDVHHTYEANGQVLYQGDGGRRGSSTLGAVVENVGAGEYLGGLAIAPDGSIYYADEMTNTVWRTAQLRSTRVAGSAAEGSWGFNGDGGPAISARLNHPTDVALAPNGSLYIADSLNKRIRRIGVDGIITTVAGNGTSWPALNVDGLPATSVGLAMPWGVAVAPD